LVIAALALIVGAVLVLDGNSGIDSLKGSFSLLGILLLVIGLVIAGYGLMLRQRAMSEPD
jgi:hypothetical protein